MPTAKDATIDDLTGSILIFAASSYIWHRIKKASTINERKSNDIQTTTTTTFKNEQTLIQSIIEDSTHNSSRMSYLEFSKSQEPSSPPLYGSKEVIQRQWSSSAERFDHHFDFDHDYQSIDEVSFESKLNNDGKDEKYPMIDIDDYVSYGEMTRRGSWANFNRDGNMNNGNGYSNKFTESSKEVAFGAHTAELDNRYVDNPNNIHHSPSLSKVREAYNSKIMPRRLIMIRHGQSEGNVDEAMYAKCPDSNIRLTKLGWDQAKMAGRILRRNVLLQKNASVHFIVSPYIRCMETFHGLASAWCNPNQFSHIKDEKVRLRLWYEKLAEMGVTFNEDPRIREQDFGNYQDQEAMEKAKAERYKFGIFYYRFPNGESASDVFDRISTFLDSLWRSFCSNPSKNYVLVTHGISIRVLLARYFRYTVDQFNVMANPSNCEMVILGHDGHGKLELEGRVELKNEESCGEKTGEAGYQFYEKLKVSKWHTGSRKIRMDYC